MNANRNIKINTGISATNTEKLASGYRINRAADDAAGLSISEKMRALIRGLTKASKNCQDGISMVQTAEGALHEVHAMLQRMNELAVQSANGTNTAADREALQKEFEHIQEEIDRVSQTTTFNAMRLFADEDSSAGTTNAGGANGANGANNSNTPSVTSMDEMNSPTPMMRTMSMRSATPQVTNVLIGSLNLSGIDLVEGVDYSYTVDEETFAHTLKILSDKQMIIVSTGDPRADRIIINDNVEANLIMHGVNIDVSDTDYACALQLYKGASLNLELSGENTLKSGSACAGLQVGEGSTLVITESSTGSLNASATNGGAGIGGGANMKSGTIIINGGTVTANGRSGGAGIGSGSNKDGGTVIINGGTITARGDNGAGIGGGYNGDGGNITINGGSVNSSSSGGAGIGGGTGGTGGNITIIDGTVIANGGSSGAGIGGGSGAAGGEINISGGTIQATGANDAAGIGGGNNGKGGTINISGGEVTAKGLYTGSGIGGGGHANGGTTNITGGKINATSTNSGAGIGGGYGGSGGEINISGGEITATGGSNIGAGIGGGFGGAGGEINISGGTIEAKGGGAGIGGGRGGNGGNINISDGDVTATGDGGAGIGGGTGNHGGDIDITGGTVTARGGWASAGIGGGENAAAGDIDISGGVIVANAGYDAAGIGSGSASDGTKGATYIDIIGGDVTATGGGAGAGIGNGANSIYGDIIINGGTVRAAGYSGGAGIGYGSGSSVTTLQANGNAIINTTSINVSASNSHYGGFIITGGTITGNLTLPGDYEIRAGETLTIAEGATLTIPDGVTLINNGTLTNNGSIKNNGTVVNNGTINGSGNVTGSGAIQITIDMSSLSGNLTITDAGYKIGNQEYAYTGDYILTGSSSFRSINISSDANITLDNIDINDSNIYVNTGATVNMNLIGENKAGAVAVGTGCTLNLSGTGTLLTKTSVNNWGTVNNDAILESKTEINNYGTLNNTGEVNCYDIKNSGNITTDEGGINGEVNNTDGGKAVVNTTASGNIDLSDVQSSLIITENGYELNGLSYTYDGPYTLTGNEYTNVSLRIESDEDITLNNMSKLWGIEIDDNAVVNMTLLGDNTVGDVSVKSGSTLNLLGTGTLNVEWTGTVENDATLNVGADATLVNKESWSNNGTLENVGTIDNDGDFGNFGIINNQVGGVLDNIDGALVNHGTITNEGGVIKGNISGNQPVVAGNNTIDLSSLSGELEITDAGYRIDGTDYVCSGPYTLTGDTTHGITISSDVTINLTGDTSVGNLSVASGNTLTLGGNSTLTFNGVLDNKGTIANTNAIYQGSTGSITSMGNITGKTVLQGNNSIDITNIDGDLTVTSTGYRIGEQEYLQSGTLTIRGSNQGRNITVDSGATTFAMRSGGNRSIVMENVDGGDFVVTGNSAVDVKLVGDNVVDNINVEGGSTVNYSGTGTIRVRNTLTNNGTINNGADSTIENDGTLDNGGTINNSGTVDNDGTVNNGSGGTINNENGGTIDNSGDFNNGGSVNNNSGGTVNNNTGSTMENTGTIENNGTMKNDGTMTGDDVTGNAPTGSGTGGGTTTPGTGGSSGNGGTGGDSGTGGTGGGTGGGSGTGGTGGTSGGSGTGGTGGATAGESRNSWWIQAGAGAGQGINLQIGAMNTKVLGIEKDTVNILTQESSGNAITAVNDAIKKVSEQRTRLGAYQNRLEHTILNLDNTAENTANAESRIRDTDMAEEMVEHSKNSIITQAAQAILAQANQQSQDILYLLR